ncbi:hypothetical protein CSB45_13280 [candidate division KSB3 bacterium]|uniref:Uncharacterized protein n=1 Tax=candidate division KSB3 bacterium TaxID=2044937 RepID=A0A2G6E1W6_9BACT|nr:MAG: hypothetical protein CSB45_13280 [candidate division KSB3 bacterium]PIE28668.1 MAG: hypothetical protein CSA57_12935 [candidate division KSB3 bacterium]
MKTKIMKHLLTLLVIAVILGTYTQAFANHVSRHTLYAHGAMETVTAQYVEALVEHEGKILFVGRLKDKEIKWELAMRIYWLLFL